MKRQTTVLQSSWQLHGRCIDSATGELKSHYLKVIDTLEPEVQASTSQSSSDTSTISVCAETITKRVCEYTTMVELDMVKMRGIGTDDVSTMIGCRNGVVTCLKSITTSPIGVHRAAHRLNLASLHAADSEPNVKNSAVYSTNCMIF